MPDEAYYRADLALVHHLGFGFHADRVAPSIVDLLAPVLAMGGRVVEVGAGSGLLTRFLLDAGLRVLATDASAEMLKLARGYAPGAEGYEILRLPGDPVPTCDAVVSVGHPVSYVDTADDLLASVAAMADGLRPGGVLAFDVCDLAWGAARRDQAPLAKVEDEWAIVTRYPVVPADRFERAITTFVRDDATGTWRRSDEHHVNVLVDVVADVLPVLAAHGVDADARSSFSGSDADTLPEGLLAVVGRKGR